VTRAALHARHAEYYLAWAEAVARQLSGADEEAALDRLEQEYDNLRAVLDWALGQESHEVAARMMVALLRFWNLCGYWSEDPMSAPWS
jgi:predicted ATPase